MSNPANVLSFSHQQNMLNETLSPFRLSKMFDKKHFITNLRDDSCFIVLPSERHVEGTQPCAPSPTSNSDETLNMIDDEEHCSGKIYG